jgi:hypothetical protein
MKRTLSVHHFQFTMRDPYSVIRLRLNGKRLMVNCATEGSA